MTVIVGTACIDSTIPDWTGELELRTATRGSRSYAHHQFHRGTLRVLRPHYLDNSGQVTYTIINPGGAYFGGDNYLIDVGVGAGSSLLLTTQSATKVYRTPQGPANQEMRIRIGEDATLEYLPDQLIVYREGSYLQHTLVEMHPSAGLALAEVITPGWSPEGTDFAFDELRMTTEIRLSEDDGGARLLAMDRLRIVPSENVSQLGFMEGYSHTGQLILAHRGIDQAVFDALAELVADSDAYSGTYSGITRAGVDLGCLDGLPSPTCVVVRTLANRTGAITALQHAVVDLLRQLIGDRESINLRKP